MGEAQPRRDLFDGILEIEERLVEEGRDEGLNAASALGILEGKSRALFVPAGTHEAQKERSLVGNKGSR